MEQTLINAIKNNEILYNKSSLLYRNKCKRAAAWNSISKELNLPENVCKARWKSLRDQYVKKVAESHREFGSGAEITDSQWQYKEEMEFLREHVKPRRTLTSFISKNSDENSMEASPTSRMIDNRYQSSESLTDAQSESKFSVQQMEFCEVVPSVSTFRLNSESNPSSWRKRTRWECESEAFIEFLNKMTKIAETRFAAPPPQKESVAHDGFFAMVSEIFDDLPSDTVKNAKFFFLNYLRDQVIATNKKKQKKSKGSGNLLEQLPLSSS